MPTATTPLHGLIAYKQRPATFGKRHHNQAKRIGYKLCGTVTQVLGGLLKQKTSLDAEALQDRFANATCFCL
ncbi:hypothetical protein L596_003003 [Steinernema carpocapsae]|uniref:Uncharacterized protein n=1 Tax=Steinernema carpocapsae TaxID=34508 RepID=A0A4U8URU7_STECR|nr:hypothetical protein L596_003003 [Steinernema carpocapsae]